MGFSVRTQRFAPYQHIVLTSHFWLACQPTNSLEYIHFLTDKTIPKTGDETFVKFDGLSRRTKYSIYVQSESATGGKSFLNMPREETTESGLLPYEIAFIAGGATGMMLFIALCSYKCCSKKCKKFVLYFCDPLEYHFFSKICVWQNAMLKYAYLFHVFKWKDLFIES